MAKTVSYRHFFVHPSVDTSLVADFIEENIGKGQGLEGKTDVGRLRLIEVYRLKDDFAMGLISEWEHTMDKRKLALLKITDPDKWNTMKKRYDVYESQVEFINDHGYTVVTQDVLEHLKE